MKVRQYAHGFSLTRCISLRLNWKSVTFSLIFSLFILNYIIACRLLWILNCILVYLYLIAVSWSWWSYRNNPDKFCHICEEYIFNDQRKSITDFVRNVYLVYVKVKLCDLARNQGGRRGRSPPYKIFLLLWKNVLSIVENYWRHSLKNLGPSQKTLRHPWCPKLVTGLFVTKINHWHHIVCKAGVESLKIWTKGTLENLKVGVSMVWGEQNAISMTAATSVWWT